MLSCKGAPKKPTQKLEWKLVSRTPPTHTHTWPHTWPPKALLEGPQHPALTKQFFPRGPSPLRFFSSLQNTGRTEAWKVLSPQGDPWDSVARILPNGSLLLPAIGIVDEGTFRCRATNRLGKEVKSNYRVRVYRKGSRPWLSHFAFNKKPSFTTPQPPPLTLSPGVSGPLISTALPPMPGV